MKMKKIFVSIIALAALVGCNTSMVEEVVTTLSAPMEVAVDGSSRVFDNDLKWSWQSDDTIAALQLAGDMTVNTLTLKENGKFGTDEFKYATAEAASFMFVYPAEAFDSSTFSYKFVQTGAWTPTLTGFVADATIGSFSTIEMVHQSAAFEIRVWEAGRQTRKSIKSATITSTADFLNGYGNTATVSGIESDTVVFNLAAGDYDFELTLTDADDTVYTVAVPTKNFVAGKRTILNVEWKAEPAKDATVSFLAYSSYNESDGDVIKNDNLSGTAIYVSNVVVADADAADVASVKLLINGAERADITSGSATVSGLGYGAYNVAAKLTLNNGYTYTTPESVVYVTGIPYHADWRSADQNCTLKKIADKGSYLRVDDAGWFKSVLGCIITPAFNIPGGSLNVYTAIAASTGATSTGDYDRSYYYAGNSNSSPAESGNYVTIGYKSADSNNPDTPLVAGTEAVTLTTSNPSVVFTAKDFSPATSTNVYQVKVTYNKQ